MALDVYSCESWMRITKAFFSMGQGKATKV